MSFLGPRAASPGTALLNVEPVMAALPFPSFSIRGRNWTSAQRRKVSRIRWLMRSLIGAVLPTEGPRSRFPRALTLGDLRLDLYVRAPAGAHPMAQRPFT